MKINLFIKDKLFLRVFLVSIAIIVILALTISTLIYRMSFNSLQQEILSMNANVANEITIRFNDSIKKINEKTIEFEMNEMVRLFFSSKNPSYFFENYYMRLQNALSMAGISYVDDVMLCSENYSRIFNSGMSQSYDFDDKSLPEDLKWIREFDSKSSEYKLIVRANNNSWPYYITVGRKYYSSENNGYIFVNINLEKFYDYLVENCNSNMKLYVINQNRDVIINENKKLLFTPITYFTELKKLMPKQNTNKIKTNESISKTYTQIYDEQYDLDFVTITPIGNYNILASKVKNRFFLMLFIALSLGLVLSILFSIRIVKPQHEKARLSEELKYRNDLLNDAQMLALQVQINPHFLYNTLNIISLTVETDFGEEHPVSSMISELSDILRYSVSKEKTVLIKDEIECAKKYLALMQYRYDSFNVKFDVDDTLLNCMMPKMIIQPIVENSIQHGIIPYGNKGKKNINITIKKTKHNYENSIQKESILISIIDDGIGMCDDRIIEIRKQIEDYDSVSGDHIGILNVVQRLHLLYQDMLKISIESKINEGTKINLIFPLN